MTRPANTSDPRVAIEVRISVSDQGPGVPDDFLSEAVKPFKTADQSRSDGGTGLGLALVSAVARLHDGTVNLTNTDPGLCVTLAINLARETAPSS